MASNNSNVILSYIQQPLQSPAHNSVNKSNGGAIIKSKDYELNHHKNLIKKRKHCDRHFMNIIPKDGGRQLKIECSAGCFELLKAELEKLALDQELSITFRIACIVEKSIDVAGNLPQITIKVHSLRKNGYPNSAPKMYHKYLQHSVLTPYQWCMHTGLSGRDPVRDHQKPGTKPKFFFPR
ncbi:hypothetical protein DPMN_186086 [Dreissena polymorpha]|uniref:Uncharacterized protein n=1 Tax=Dreissena polymorpha TaxID=45954 RepID=A0A9D4I7W1_DREPO|nr:hypothetical protein DPMN_186086 [Dreissena polymorpha]